jgi:hypothetical protein
VSNSMAGTAAPAAVSSGYGLSAAGRGAERGQLYGRDSSARCCVLSAPLAFSVFR